MINFLIGVGVTVLVVVILLAALLVYMWPVDHS